MRKKIVAVLLSVIMLFTTGYSNVIASNDENVEQVSEEVQTRSDEEAQTKSSEEAQTKSSEGVINASTSISNAKPYSGESFDVVLYVNSMSTSEQEAIKNLKIVIDVPTSVELVKAPSSNSEYKVTRNGSLLEITFNKDVSFGELRSFVYTFYIKEGVSTPTNTSFTGQFTISGDNVDSTQVSTKTIVPSNISLPTIMTKEVPTIDPTLIHTSKIMIQPENFVGGLNHNNANVRLDFPAGIEFFDLRMDGTKIDVQTGQDGKKFANIPLDVLVVGKEKKVIEITYAYPPTTDASVTYEILANYTAKRHNGENVNEEIKIVETVKSGGGSSNRFMQKTGQDSIMKIPGQGLSFSLSFIPGSSFNDVSMIDDPVRGGEANYFDAVRYESITWNAMPSYDPSIQGKIKTQFMYELASNPGVWKAYGVASETGSINVGQLNLSAGDYITRVKFDYYNSDGTRAIQKNSGYVFIRLFLSTTDKITSSDADLSFVSDSTLTNSAYIVGKTVNHQGVQEDIVDDGVKNKKTSDVKVEDAKTLIGFERWENHNAFTKNPVEINEPFTYGARAVPFNLDIKDAIMFIEINDPNVEIKDIRFSSSLRGYSYENATYEVRKTNSATSIKVNFNNTVPVSNWGDPVWVELDAVAHANTSDVVQFKAMMSSENQEQPFQGVKNEYFDGFGYVRCGANIAKSWLNVSKSLAMNTKVHASKDNTNYSLTTNLEAVNGKGTAQYRLQLENPASSSSDYEQSVMIVSLPKENDKLVVSNSAKGSTIQPTIQKLVKMDGTNVDPSIHLFYSDTNDYTNNLKELQDLSTVVSNWIPWDGQTPLPTSASAIRIENTGPVKPGEKIEFKIEALFENVDENVEVAWLSVASGAQVAGVYSVPGEPTKSGVYVSGVNADAKITGNLWEDIDGNGIQMSEEPKVENVEVRLYDWNNDLVDTKTTDASGKYAFTDLYHKLYRVEFNMPVGKVLSDRLAGTNRDIDSDFDYVDQAKKTAQVYVNLKANSDANHIDAGIYSYASIGDYVWHDLDNNGKQDSYEEGIKNVQLKLYKVDTTTRELSFIKNTKTDANGKYNFTSLTPGEYVIEASKLDGYQPTLLKAQGVNDGENSILTSTYFTQSIYVKSGDVNKKADMGYRDIPLGSITVTKQGNNEVLEGATYGIWNAGDDINSTPLQTMTTNSSGVLSFTSLAVGDYQIKELSAPVGYVLDETVHLEAISETLLHVSTTYTNELSKASIQIVKVDEMQNVVEGAEFTLYKGSVDKENIVATKVSDAKGELIFCGLDQGEYIVVETKSPVGFEENSQQYKVVLDKTTLSKSLTIMNKLKLGNIQITKLDTNKKVLEGATFGLWRADDANNAPLLEATSNELGLISFSSLPQGKYIVKEIKAPKGYILTTTTYELEIKRTELEVRLEVINELEKKDEGKKEEGKKEEGKKEEGNKEKDKQTTSPKTGVAQGISAALLLMSLMSVVIFVGVRRKKSE